MKLFGQYLLHTPFFNVCVCVIQVIYSSVSGFIAMICSVALLSISCLWFLSNMADLIVKETKCFMCSNCGKNLKINISIFSDTEIIF